MPRNIKELDLKELEQLLEEWGEPRFHAGQVFSWIYQKGASSFDEMSNLSARLRKRLEESFFLSGLKQTKALKSSDGTQKLLFTLADGNLVEAVIIPVDERVTGCVSTQVGCKFACCFCASGMLGFKRNLTAAEILDEVLYLKRGSVDNKLTHLVFMGTGEPFDNYDNLLKAVRVINSPKGLNIGARRITISSSGIIPGIKRLADEGLQVELSISLHAPDDKTRSMLMPVNKKYPVKDLIQACREYAGRTNRQITFEYILLKNVNCSTQKARELAGLLKGLNCKVNLIIYNPVKELRFEPPGKLEILFFKDALIKAGINCIIRKERGGDIDAACGQLRLKYDKSKK
ncbi:MAG: 23S rRNA (adenine(2503)-C(2))-methyltransferase RlmN [Candidatus Omnitrophica bacterium]|nr:23S rRNA (adenine(2503)-C(2))-methyltransferase RlmN [Candidatus Omnitrophota bacterium]MDD5655263.1 23S rRNA (adenine(2503)-C(2))-methyltransferase RlmN [Candidatus Omnitrophota bacterium]